MANFQNSFTGKGTGIVLDDGGKLNQAQQNMSNMILKTEQMKAETFQKNQQEFLKNSNIDPVFVLSTSSRETQQKLLDDFNTTWGKAMKNSGGNLSLDQKMQMQKQKDYIQMTQQKLQSDMETAQLHNKMVSQNPNRWDATEQAQRYNDYIQTGNYNYTEPPIKPLSLMDAAMKMQSKVATKEFMPVDEQKTYNVGGVPYKVSTSYSASKEDVIPYIKSAIANNDQYAAGALQEWNGLSQPEKDKYHTSDPSNPVFAMAVDKHWKEWVTSKQKEEKNTLPKQDNLSSDWTTIMDGTKKVSYPVPPPSTVALGDKFTSQKYYQLPTTTAKPISLKSTNSTVQVLTKGMVGTVKHPPVISGIPTGYDAEHDTFTFNVNKDFSNIGISGIQSGNNMQIAIPRSEINNTGFLNSFVVLDDNGKKVKISDLSPATATQKTAPPTSGVKWK